MSLWIRRGRTISLSVALALVAMMLLGTAAAAQGTGNGQGSGALASSGSLTDEEVAGLQYMIEEEKLARDVYSMLSERWGFAAFGSISASEQRHMDALARLLERYGLENPIREEVGVFANSELQGLYDQLIASGEESLADALRVGAAIEEIDILDLEHNISETGRADIVRVYESLLRGSENHLRAFTRALERETSESYVPQYLSHEAYESIVGSSSQRGNGRGSGGRRGMPSGRSA